jgi:hypothetical protein
MGAKIIARVSYASYVLRSYKPGDLQKFIHIFLKS